MKRTSAKRNSPVAFSTVRLIGLEMPGVESTTRYDGSPVLKVDGCFMAGLAMHRSAEPDTLVIRSEFEQRGFFIEDAPDTYYVTDFYRKYPVVLVRLSRVDSDALRDLLSMSWRLTMAKTGKYRRRTHPNVPGPLNRRFGISCNRHPRT